MSANLHNPDGLTSEQVGRGWRLLTQEEVRHLPDDAECWALVPGGTARWKPSRIRGLTGFSMISYRTQKPFPNQQ